MYLIILIENKIYSQFISRIISLLSLQVSQWYEGKYYIHDMDLEKEIEKKVAEILFTCSSNLTSRIWLLTRNQSSVKAIISKNHF